MTAPTPTSSPDLPFRPGGFATLADGLDYAARGATGLNFFSARGELAEAVPYRALRERALALASRLAGGLPRGERVALVAETSADFAAAFFACQYAGLVPVPLPLSVNIGGREAYVRRLRAMLAAADARLALGPADLAGTLAEAAEGTATREVGTAADVAAWRPAAGRLRPLGPGEPCYVQYSSGSTSLPRGVLVTQRALAANATAIATHGLALAPGDRCTSWLPLYHDMGLVGCCLTPALAQVTVDYLPSTAFARRPLLWLQLLSRHGGTISFSPTFGYELCVRRTDEGGPPEGLDLGAWRVAGVGGEMVRPNVLEAFAARFAAAGFDARALLPSYGLAEATLAVTFSRLGRGVAVDAVARGRALEAERRAVPVAGPADPRPARRFVVCGGPMPGYAVEVRDASGSPLPDRRLGRVCVSGPSVMAGYDRDEAASAGVVLGDGWLDTGDIGYLVDGELVVTGRSKDLIIVGGRNIWPQDVEWAVERLDGVRAGDVAAFAAGDDAARAERVVVVVECRASGAAREALRASVAGALRRTAGVEGEVVLAPPRSLTFTTSGKLSRAAARADYLSGAIRDLGAPSPPAAAADLAGPRWRAAS